LALSSAHSLTTNKHNSLGVFHLHEEDKNTVCGLHRHTHSCKLANVSFVVFANFA